jgi:hypothetical protein
MFRVLCLTFNTNPNGARSGSAPHGKRAQNNNRRIEPIMKTTIAIQIAVLSIGALLAPVSGHSQTYYLSTPITGRIDPTIGDLTSGTSGAYTASLTTLTESIFIDTNAQTIRQVGSIAVSPATGTIHLVDTQGSVSGTLDVTYSFVGGLSFDTGVQHATWNGSSKVWTVNDTIPGFTMNATYSLVTGGQTYSGAFNCPVFTQPLVYGSAWTFKTISTTSDPTILSVSSLGWNNGGYPGVGFPSSVSPAAVDFTAADGFHLQLWPTTGNFSWSTTGSVTAVLVPEPCATLMLGLGLLGLGYIRRNR